MAKRILILCTGNSCRSQMAEYFLRSFDPTLNVQSAGVNPAGQTNPYTVRVMQELGISMSGSQPKSVDRFLNDSFDYVITVCDHAKETCPVFLGRVKHRLHMGFEDPAEVRGTEEFVLSEYRRLRDQIKSAFQKFYTKTLAKEK
jgi:arsenate reductase